MQLEIIIIIFLLVLVMMVKLSLTNEMAIEITKLNSNDRNVVQKNVPNQFTKSSSHEGKYVRLNFLSS